MWESHPEPETVHQPGPQRTWGSAAHFTEPWTGLGDPQGGWGSGTNHSGGRDCGCTCGAEQRESLAPASDFLSPPPLAKTARERPLAWSTCSAGQDRGAGGWEAEGEQPAPRFNLKGEKPTPFSLSFPISLSFSIRSLFI